MYSLFFNDTATTGIYTLSLHDALPIFGAAVRLAGRRRQRVAEAGEGLAAEGEVDVVQVERVQVRDRKSTRLNSSHVEISYAVFCLKKKTNKYTSTTAVPMAATKATPRS